MATLKQSKPLPPTVKLVNPDGTPTREFHTWLTRQYDNLSGSDIAPATASIAAAGLTGRVVATLATRGAKAPVSYTIVGNPDALGVTFAGAELRTSADPVGSVGTHFLSVRGTDAEAILYTGTLKLTLT